MSNDQELRQFVSMWEELTSDKIIRRGGQANPTCQLCRTENESPNHKVADCSFSKMVWLILAQKLNLQMLNQNKTSTRIKEWWTAMNGQGDDTRRTQLVIYAVWDIWKERCRRVFDNKAQTPAQVASIIQQDIFLYDMAQGNVHVNI
ncbi:hypothetical protein SORBI_3005G153066 [Sorghum bicolor]|uniref:Reverse transcriptase zinc-binding domain-containing protein n=1 Tax=Sorghum bicolor TaxID=4558 RepID=A0A1Z5RJC3_SORBI|nr:hypothetical protein SORBI_3005G153066 [Sorghum bicolor]